MQEKKKILYLDTPIDPPGGGQLSLLLLLKNLSDSYAPHVFLTHNCLFKKWLDERNIPNTVVTALGLFRAIKNFGPHIVHCNSATTRYTFLGAIFSKLLNIPFIWHVRVTQRILIKDDIIYALSTAVIAISSAVRDKFNRKQKTVIIHNGTDTETFRPGINSQAIRKELSIPENEKIIGTIGRLDKWKGHNRFIEMAELVFSGLKNVHFMIIGSGTKSQVRELKEMAAKSGIGERLHLIGFRNDIPELISAMDILVHCPDYREAFGRVVIEAMSEAKPVIASKNGGMIDIITDKENGFLIPVNDTRLMADKCIYLLSNPGKAKDIGLKARQHVENNFSDKLYASRIMELYPRFCNRIRNSAQNCVIFSTKKLLTYLRICSHLFSAKKFSTFASRFSNPIAKSGIMTEHCKICQGSAVKRENLTEAPYVIMECAKCGILFVDPEPQSFSPEEHYDKNYYSAWENTQKKERIKLWQKRFYGLKKISPKSNVFLDIGIGTGLFLSVAKQNGCSVYGTEISPSACKIAKETYGLQNIFCGSLEGASFPDNYFDVVTLWHVLEHLSEPSAAIKEARRILKPGGILTVAVPNTDAHVYNFIYRIVKMKRPLLFSANDREVHLFHFRKKSLQYILENNNFTVIKNFPDMGQVRPFMKFIDYLALPFYLIFGKNMTTGIKLYARKTN